MRTLPVKTVIGLAIAFMLGIGMLSGGSWAYFADIETSTGNVLTAGTLNLVSAVNGTGPAGKYTVIAGGDGLNGNVVFIKGAPGDSGTITWVLNNSGSLPGTLTIASTVTFADNDDNEPESASTAPHANNGGGNGDLDEFVGVKLQRGAGTDQTTAEAAFSYLMGSATRYVPFTGLEAKLDAESRSISASGGSDTIVYKLSWNIATNVKGAGTDGLFGTADDIEADDNIIQSDSATIDISFNLNQ